jgi:lipopolysaccharide transport system ATP-binding protein
LSNLAIDVAQLTKTYRIYGRPLDRLREAILRRPRHREFRALDDVSFTVARGEAIGVIGENGAGKSTLLKILAGVAEPSAGSSRVQGRVAAILELGSGFHPEFSGRENAVLNAALLGLSETEVRRRLPEILEWSELDGFIDQPVKTYSTGMAMRLGFAIATQVEPDILIVDEALSVGDGYFQKKCIDRLQQMSARGTTILFCSHAMYYITAFCERALWLSHGRVAALGPAREVVGRYEESLVRKAAIAPADEPAAPASADRRARLTAVRPLQSSAKALPGSPWLLEIAWQSSDPALRFHIGVGLNRVDGIEVASFASHFDGLPPWTGASDYQTRLAVPALPLLKGEFTIYVFLLDENGLHIFDQCIMPAALTVESPAYRFGLVEIAHRWEAGDRAEPAQLIATPG